MYAQTNVWGARPPCRATVVVAGEEQPSQLPWLIRSAPSIPAFDTMPRRERPTTGARPGTARTATVAIARNAGQPSESLRQACLTVLEPLRARSEEVAQAIYTRIQEAVPDAMSGEDPDYREGVKRAIEALLHTPSTSSHKSQGARARRPPLQRSRRPAAPHKPAWAWGPCCAATWPDTSTSAS